MERKHHTGLCPVFKKCGGCQYLDLSYASQLAKKEARMRELLRGICEVKPIHGMEDPFHYRNKTHAVFGKDRRRQVVCGIYQEGTHRIVPVTRCMIENEKADEIIQTIRGMLRSFRIPVYDEDGEKIEYVVKEEELSAGLAKLYYIDSVQIPAEYRDRVGEHVTVYGKVMTAHTGHHLRDIVLT